MLGVSELLLELEKEDVGSEGARVLAS